MDSHLSCDELNRDLAVLLLDAGAVTVFTSDEARRILSEHRAMRPAGVGLSAIEQMATAIYARRKEYGLCGHLKGRSCNQSAQISAIRSAICLIADTVVREEPSVIVGSISVSEVPCGLDLTPYEALVTA